MSPTGLAWIKRGLVPFPGGFLSAIWTPSPGSKHFQSRSYFPLSFGIWVNGRWKHLINGNVFYKRVLLKTPLSLSEPRTVATWSKNATTNHGINETIDWNNTFAGQFGDWNPYRQFPVLLHWPHFWKWEKVRRKVRRKAWQETSAKTGCWM